MSNAIIASARRIAEEIKSTEGLSDAALAAKARLTAELLESRVAAGVPARTGRDAVGKLIEAIACSARARELVIDAHEGLAGLDLRELAAGDLSECPDSWKILGPRLASDSEAA
ncbi:hypothetical protein [Allosphingosinicella indica]|uniref:Uncharacterized protein n=1 Tax=Allosphingosinicella indica TaxID=941907 RepID=A0A1X7FYE2_9SPHN|nr:hypothetical protein [Allosphingosinicella indica]SMF61061.1 hypothetical protein SAMN06295910_0104 [Allosphingosinicella indica]